MKMSLVKNTFFTLAILGTALSPLAARAKNKDLVIALKPDKNPDQMLAEKQTLEKELGKILKQPVKVLIPTSSSIILQGFSNGSIDIGYLSSLDMYNAKQNKSADILLVGEINGRSSYDSIWLVKKEDSAKSIQDLKQKPIAFSSRTSTSGFLIPYADLVKRNLIKAKQDPAEFFGKNNVWYGTGYVSAVQKVLSGEAAAAAVSDYVYLGDKHLSPEQKAQLRVLQTQGPVPSHIIGIRNTLNEKERNRIKAAILELGKINPSLRDKVFGSVLIEAPNSDHIKVTEEALSLTNFSASN